jgi:hypothetical protein
VSARGNLNPRNGAGSKILYSLLMRSVAAAVALCGLAHAQTFNSNVEQVAVPVTVSSERNAPLPDLRPNDFRVFDDGRPVPIVAFGRVRQSVHMRIKEINFLLLEIENAFAKLTSAPGAGSTSGGQGRFSALRLAQQDYFDIERILEWHQFGTYDRFIAHHKQLLARLNAMLKKQVLLRVGRDRSPARRRGLSAGARTSARCGLGSRWFAEGLHRDALITHLEDLQLLRTAWRMKDDTIAHSALHQGTGQW